MTGCRNNMAVSPTFTQDDRPEIVIGFVGAIGTNLSFILDAFHTELERVGYSTSQVKLTDLLREIDRFQDLPTSRNADSYRQKMNAGDELRRQTGFKDILARMAIAYIWQLRVEHHQEQEKPIPSRAYLLQSLKTPEEAETLRKVYGSSLFLVSVYAPRNQRKAWLSKEFAAAASVVDTQPFLDDAEKLIKRDEADTAEAFGQNVRETFPLADAFIDASDDANYRVEVQRLIELLFGNTFHTPTMDEHAMFHAAASALRSSSLSRQVGAVITDTRGSILATGANEVPRAMGGTYWPHDAPDERDGTSGWGYEPNDRMIRQTINELVDRLSELGWSPGPGSPTEIEALLDGLKGTRAKSLIEFTRSVHAEMVAITDAARLGIPLAGATLYTTTFPCHNCTKHLIATGIQRVLYVDPYVKSLALPLHRDAVRIDGESEPKDGVVFRPFVGVAPRRYMDLFTMGKRKSPAGEKQAWTPAGARYEYARYSEQYTSLEAQAAATLQSAFQKAQLQMRSGKERNDG
jgi:cytidine deaminase